MIGNLIALALLVAIFVAAWRDARRQPAEPDVAQRAAVALYGIHRRMQSALVRAEIRLEATRLRRELEDELDQADDTPAERSRRRQQLRSQS